MVIDLVPLVFDGEFMSLFRYAVCAVVESVSTPCSPGKFSPFYMVLAVVLF